MTCGSGRRNNSVYRKRVRLHFGTLCSFEAWAQSSEAAVKALQAGFTELERFSDILNPYDPRSELSYLNAHASAGPLRVSPELFAALELAYRVSALTDGRFDLTGSRVLRHWIQAAASDMWPSEHSCLEAARAYDYRDVKLCAQSRTVCYARSRVSVDLSGLAKGMALDAAMAAMQAGEVETLRLDAGGEWLVWDRYGRDVEIAVAGADQREAYIGALRLGNQAVATSSQNEPRLFIQGEAVGHLFDLGTGQPLQQPAQSVSVVAERAVLADVLATALFVSGSSYLKRLRSAFPEVRGVVDYSARGLQLHDIATWAPAYRLN